MGGSRRQQVWEGVRHLAHPCLPSVLQRKNALVILWPFPALLPLQVRQGEDNLMLVPGRSLEAQPAQADAGNRHIQKREGKSMSHLSEDSDFPRHRHERFATIILPCSEGKLEARGGKNPFPCDRA